jgi:hypothetical protein
MLALKWLDNCIYMKVKGGNIIILILYVDDILLVSTDTNMLNETKGLVSSNFDMKNLGDAFYVLGTQIYRDRSIGVSELCKKIIH